MIDFQVESMSINQQDMQFEGDSCDFSVSAKPQLVSLFISTAI